MAQEIYHRSEWGNPTETWGNVYLNADLTNELYKRASEYENSWVTDQLLNGVGIKPSIILTPTAYEDGVLNSVKPSNSDADFDFTRGSSATRVNEQGLIEDVTETNLPRINYIDGEGSLLLENQSTNLVPYSEDFSQLSTVTSGGTVIETANFSEAPNGKNEATRLQMSSVSGYALKGYTIPSFNDYFYVSVYLKSNTTENQQVAIYGRNSVNQSYTVTPQWQRFEVACDGSSASSYFYFGVRTSYGSDADIDISAWGVQAEQGTYATSYIPTNGSTVTRLADICNNSGNSDLINSTEGVLYAEISALADDLTNRIIALSDNDSSDHVRIYYTNSTNKISVAVKSNGNNQYVFLNHSITDITDFIKIAVKYKANDFATFINGVQVNTQTTTANTPIGLDRLNFDNGAGASDFYGNVKCVAVFKEALSDTELEKLTTI